MVATTILVIGFVLALFVGLPYLIISGVLSSQGIEIPQIVAQILMWVIGIPVGIPLFVAFSVTPFMFAIVMPAAAVGKKIGLYEARDIAAPIYPQIFVIWFCNAVFAGLLGALLYYLIVKVGDATSVFFLPFCRGLLFFLPACAFCTLQCWIDFRTLQDTRRPSSQNNRR